MEKLIELLNEWYIERYGTTPHFVRFEDYWGNDYWYFVWDDKLMVETEVWTKKYWFIEWLVQNDKIDFDKCWLDVRHYLSYNKRYDKWIVIAENYDNDTFVVREFYSPYEQLLMLLAISDNPIDLLCEIIKN